MTKERTKSKYIPFRISPKQLKILDRLVRRRKTSRSEVIRHLIINTQQRNRKVSRFVVNRLLSDINAPDEVLVGIPSLKYTNLLIEHIVHTKNPAEIRIGHELDVLIGLEYILREIYMGREVTVEDIVKERHKKVFGIPVLPYGDMSPMDFTIVQKGASQKCITRNAEVLLRNG